MLLAAAAARSREMPPAYNVPPDTASADTSVASSNPEPSADQLLPSHCAM